jgi:hypothetical protein
MPSNVFPPSLGVCLSRCQMVWVFIWCSFVFCMLSTVFFPFEPTFLFSNNRVGLWDHVAVRVCVCVCVRVRVYIPPIVASILIVSRQWLGKYPPIVARQRLGIIPLSLPWNGRLGKKSPKRSYLKRRFLFWKKKIERAYEIKLLCVCVCACVCVCVSALAVASQRLVRNVIAVTNTLATIQQL